MAPIVLAATGGQAQFLPVGRPVAGAGIALGIDEGLQIMHRMAIERLPVGGNPPRGSAEEMRGEMRDAHPGQDEEAALVGDLVHVRPAHIISDDELHDLFVKLPANVLLEVYLDTCHSGTGLRGAEFGPYAPRARFIAPPDHEFDTKTPTMRGFLLDRPPVAAAGKSAAESEKAAVAGANHVLWTGCKANQTSADAYFSGRYNGAFTYYFVKVMRETQNKVSRKEVITRMRSLMKPNFAQTPQLEGNATNRAQAIVV